MRLLTAEGVTGQRRSQSLPGSSRRMPSVTGRVCRRAEAEVESLALRCVALVLVVDNGERGVAKRRMIMVVGV